MTTKNCLGRLAPAIFLLLACWAADVSSNSCPPCSTSGCPPKDSCTHGTVMDYCGCCEVCAVGEGDDCTDDEECGVGLECVKDPPAELTDQEILLYPGVCSAAVDQKTTSVQLSVTTATTEDEAAKCAQLGFVPADDASTTAEQPETEQCREECSVQYCSDPKKHKVCSAKGMEFSHVAGRGMCQHTSCRACFLLIQPPCSANCPEPPTKQCLHSYQKCIRNHIFGFSSNNLFGSASLLALDDPNAQAHANTGKIICYVTEMIA